MDETSESNIRTVASFRNSQYSVCFHILSDVRAWTHSQQCVRTVRSPCKIKPRFGFYLLTVVVMYRVGLIRIIAPGMYTFSTASSDGSHLWIDGWMVVDNGGMHTEVSASGVANLGVGYHYFKADWFSNWVSLSWACVVRTSSALDCICMHVCVRVRVHVHVCAYTCVCVRACVQKGGRGGMRFSSFP